MLDNRYFQEGIGELEKALRRRNADPALVEAVSNLSRKRKELIQKTEQLKASRNAGSQEIAKLKSKAKQDPEAAAAADRQMAAMKAVGEQIKKQQERAPKQ